MLLFLCYHSCGHPEVVEKPTHRVRATQGQDEEQQKWPGTGAMDSPPEVALGNVPVLMGSNPK